MYIQNLYDEAKDFLDEIIFNKNLRSLNKLVETDCSKLFRPFSKENINITLFEYIINQKTEEQLSSRNKEDWLEFIRKVAKKVDKINANLPYMQLFVKHKYPNNFILEMSTYFYMDARDDLGNTASYYMDNSTLKLLNKNILDYNNKNNDSKNLIEYKLSILEELDLEFLPNILERMNVENIYSTFWYAVNMYVRVRNLIYYDKLYNRRKMIIKNCIDIMTIISNHTNFYLINDDWLKSLINMNSKTLNYILSGIKNKAKYDILLKICTMPYIWIYKNILDVIIIVSKWGHEFFIECDKNGNTIIHLLAILRQKKALNFLMNSTNFCEGILPNKEGKIPSQLYEENKITNKLKHFEKY